MVENRFLQIVTVTDSEDEARRIADRLLEKRLVACAQISSPIQSKYWWKGKIEVAEEWTCTVKTTAKKYEAVESLIKQEHSYDEPEIVATSVVRGSRGYLRWIAEETNSKDGSG